MVLAGKSSRTLLTRLPWIVAVATFAFGMVYMTFAPVGHIPDVWEHVYRISGILNGDVMARPVDAQSDFHRSAENVGGRVDQMWIDYSIAHFDNYDFGVVDPASITVRDGDTAEVPYNNTAVNTPVAYAPQLLAFAAARAIGLDAGATYQLAQFVMLTVYAVAMGFAVAMVSPPPISNTDGACAPAAASDLPVLVCHLGRFVYAGGCDSVYLPALPSRVSEE